MPGPPPKHPSTRARRNASIAMTKLPASGRKGRAPSWPLLDDLVLQVDKNIAVNNAKSLRQQIADTTDGRTLRKLEKDLAIAVRRGELLSAQLIGQRKLERELWGDLWKLPQATQWELQGWTREIAQYVRWKAKAELGDLDASKEARMLADRLGLSSLSMLRLRWEVVDDEAEPKKATAKKAAPKKSVDPRKALYAVK